MYELVRPPARLNPHFYLPNLWIYQTVNWLNQIFEVWNKSTNGHHFKVRFENVKIFLIDFTSFSK